ncbi:MAG: hypothetical protein WCS28_03675 [Thiomicrospira sp.]
MRKYVIKLASIVLLAWGMSGCQTAPSSPSTLNPQAMRCLEAEFALDAIQYDLAALITTLMQREKQTFALTRIAPLTMMLLSQGGQEQLVFSGQLARFDAQQQAQVITLVTRHQQLLMAAKANQCGFVSLAESQLARQAEHSPSP